MPLPPADTISLPDTLALLDGQFAALAAGVADGAYAIWLGSGISFKKMPKLADLVEIVLEHLRTHAALAGPCAYRDSLDRILALTPLDDDEKSAIDFSQPVSTWAQCELIRRSLVLNYARMLDLAPRDKPPDYLLWNAVEVARRYASPAVTPGVEHLALAALVVEGVASEIASANWDGLLETAVARLAGTLPDLLQVCVLSADYRKMPARARLYKFHGCAVLAGRNEATYRERLVGRQSQLDAWATQNPVVEARLISLAVNQSTLMLGLSAQDFNIRGVFVHAQAQMTWPFPSDPPAFVFSEDAIGPDQQAILRNQYPADYVAMQEQIDSASLLRAYPAHLLPALWLRVAEIKFAALAESAAPHLSPADQGSLKAGLKALRDRVAADGDGLNREAFMDGALIHLGRTLALLREGRISIPGGGTYAPITLGPVSGLAADANIAASGLPQFALAVALLGHGHATGTWTCGVTLPVAPTAGAIRVQGRRTVEVFFAASERAAAQLVSEGHVNAAADVVLIHSDPITAPAARSPARTYGRATSRIHVREVSVRTLVDSGVDLCGLIQHCQLELAL